MTRFLFKVAYDGSKYYGFQRLNKEASVQKSLEQVLSKICKKNIIVKGAGRTDRGVHAYNQAFHADIDINIDENHLKIAVNSMLPASIHINSVKKVCNDFHARFNVKKKIYKYVIYTGTYSPFYDDYTLEYNKLLDFRMIKKYLKKFLGVHNFFNFTAGERANYEAIIYKVKLTKKKDFIEITFIGKSFYRYMVRNMVGALLQINEHKLTEKEFDNLLSGNESNKQILTAKSSGLYLVDIIY